MRHSLQRLSGPILLILGVLALAPVSHGAPARTADPLDAARAALRSLQFGQALKLLDPLSHSNANAQYMLALMYLNGIGVNPDPARARSLLSAAAQQGHGPAAYVLAGEYARDAAE